MASIIIFFIIFAVNNIQPVIDLAGGDDPDEVYIHEARYHPHSDDMSIGPQEYVVDFDECLYVHDIKGPDINRILKFDSTGKFLFVIDSLSVPSLDRLWFGPMTIDPKTNDLIIAGSGIPKGTYEDPLNVPYNKIPCYMFRFSESGQLLKMIPVERIPIGFLMYDYDGKFYGKYVDGGAVFDQNLQLVSKIPKMKSRGHGHSQWSHWVGMGSASQYTPDDSGTGKFLIEYKNEETKKRLILIFYDSPPRSFGGSIEGEDRYGNIYLRGSSYKISRINPEAKKVAVVCLLTIGIPGGVGDVGYDTYISPNGNLYKAALVRGVDGRLRYHIYRITPDMFQEIECEVEIREE